MALQVLQASLPIEVNPPESPLEKAAKEEKSFLAGAWHSGQEASSVASLKGRRSSNLQLQLEQTYSYIGISPPPFIIPRSSEACLLLQYRFEHIEELLAVREIRLIKDITG